MSTLSIITQCQNQKGKVGGGVKHNLSNFLKQAFEKYKARMFLSDF